MEPSPLEKEAKRFKYLACTSDRLGVCTAAKDGHHSHCLVFTLNGSPFELYRRQGPRPCAPRLAQQERARPGSSDSGSGEPRTGHTSSNVHTHNE